MDPMSLFLLASAGSIAAGGAVKVIKEIVDWTKKNKEAKRRGQKGQVSPIVFSDDTIKQIDNLPPNERKLVDTVIGMMNSDPEGFLSSIERIDPTSLEQAAQGKLPSAEQLGFPQSQNILPQLIKDTDFGPIEQQARQGFKEQTVPSIAERFSGLGGLNSTAFRNELARAGVNLEGQLSGLKSQYGLQRAGLLGNLNQKQQALDVGRSQAVGNLGLAQQGQQFGQQQALANLGLQQNQQQLGQQQQNNNLLTSLLGAGQYGTTGVSQNPGAADYAIGAGLGGLGIAGQGYLQQQNQTNLLKQLQLLQPQ